MKAINQIYNKFAWLGTLPKHWKVVRLANEFQERTEIVSDEDFTPLSVTMQGIVPQLDNIAKTDNGDNRKKVCIGDFVINSRSDRKGSGGISLYEGSVSVISNVLKANNNYDIRYTHYLFTNKLFQEEFYFHGKGIVADMWSTKYQNMRNIHIPLPPKTEQKIISIYLDETTEKINHFIAKKQEFIALLKEQRQSVINEAVTKGIDKNVKLKDSGIKWLGNIPEHWEVKKLKRCVTLNSNELDVDNIKKDLKKIALENIDNWTGKFVETGNPSFEGKGNYFKSGDVLFNKLRPYLAKAYVAKEDGIAVSELLILSPNVNIFQSQFLFQRFMTNEFINIVNGSTYGAKMPRANWTFIKNLELPIPPLEEQTKIVNHIKAETAIIDTAISKTEREIELIKEYKEAMIAEAVLGKIDMHKLEKKYKG